MGVLSMILLTLLFDQIRLGERRESFIHQEKKRVLFSLVRNPWSINEKEYGITHLIDPM
jgi:hypothetical protein